MMTRRSFLKVGQTIGLCRLPSSAAEPSRLSPLRISNNRRFLTYSDLRPFFYLGDTAWELFHRLDRNDTITYLDDRASKGFTVIQAVALAEFDGLTVPNREGHLPLVDSDPRKPSDKYFRHVDWVIAEAAKRGLYVGLLPTWGNKVLQASWEKKNEVIFDVANAYTYGRWIGARYAKTPNLIWILGGDRTPEPVIEVWRQMARGIREADSGGHLMTYHPAGRASSSKFLHAEPWLDFNMLQSSHGERDFRNDLMIAEDYQLAPTKPVLDGEPRYENHPINWKPEEKGWFDEHDVRQSAYWAVFAGACGHTYGCHDIWQFKTADREPIGFCRGDWKTSLNLPGAAQVGILRRLMEKFDYLNRLPDQTLIDGSDLDGGAHMQATRGPGYGLIYSPTGRPFEANLARLGAKRIRASWFNPRNGDRTPIGYFDAKVVKTFSPPGTSTRGNDWVLILESGT